MHESINMAFCRNKKTSVMLAFWLARKQVAERTGLEPATPGVTGRYSNRLNYRSGVSLTRLLV